MSLKLVLSVLASACITVACQNKQPEQTSNTTAASANLETPDPKFSAAVAQTTIILPENWTKKLQQIR